MQISNRKYKLFMIALCLALALMTTGVWALLQNTLGVSTNISFVATGVKGTINGEVEGGYAGVETDFVTTALGGSTALTGAEVVQFGSKYVFANITGTNSSWNGKEAYYVNGATTEKVNAVTSSATIASATSTSYTVSTKSYVSDFSLSGTSAHSWAIDNLVFEPDENGITSAITLTLTVQNTGYTIISISFPEAQQSDVMDEATSPADNILITYQTSNNGSSFSEEKPFSEISPNYIVSGGTTTIKILAHVQNDLTPTPLLDLSFQINLEKGVEVWDGTTATAFAGGTGTELDPYLIETSEQLARLASLTNSGTLATSGKYFKQTDVIVLNNYAQYYDTTSGIVSIKNCASLSTPNCTLTASSGAVVTGTIPSDLNTWTPIGNATYKFQGSYDGNGYSITGIYINNTSNYQGLFGYLYTNATIKNLRIENGYVKGNGNIGALSGYNSGTLTITNCANTSVVAGASYVAGISGYNDDVISNSYNTGAVIGGSYVGGIVGDDNSGTLTSNYNTGIVSASVDYVGGIAGESTGALTNNFNNGKVTGVGDYIGGVVGAIAGTITNCYNLGIVIGSDEDSDNTGGVVGYTDTSFVISCYNEGSVTGSYNVGGVAGQNQNASAVVNCYNIGSVTGLDTVGGLVGWDVGSVTVNCYNTGTVTGNDASSEYVGGIVGYNDGNARVMNCYNIGTIVCSGTYVGSLSGCDDMGAGTGYSYYIYGTSSGSTVTVGYLSDFDTSDQIINSEVYIGATTYTANSTSLLTVLNAWVADESSTFVTTYFSEGAFVVKPWTISGSTNGYPIIDAEVWSNVASASFAGGTGTQADPYLIENAEQLAYLATVVNNGTLATTGKYFKQIQNISLNSYTLTFDSISGLVLVKDVKNNLVCCLGTGIIGTSYHTSTAGSFGLIYATSSATNETLVAGSIPADLYDWTPIGNATYTFQGTFNGNGLMISGIYINNSNNGQGLFGYNSGAVIQNMAIENSYLVGADYVGGIVGNSANGKITNCYNTGYVGGVEYIGGVVGTSSNETVSYCYNDGTISAYTYAGGVSGNNQSLLTDSYNTGFVKVLEGEYAGGITSFNNNSTIKNCYNAGIVNGVTSVGGITGYNAGTGTIYNSFNSSSITGSGYYIGGIVGLNENSVNNCYNTGTITGIGSFGGLVGYSSGVVNYSYSLVGSASNLIGENSGTLSNSSTFDADQILNSAVTLGTTYSADTTSLTTILNAWIAINQTSPATYKTWTLTGSSNGYPIFA